MNVQFTDHSAEALETMKAAALRGLEKCGLVAERYAKKLCAVDTGNLRNSITHQVDESEKAVYIGTNSEYGPYVELGTGEFYPGGRDTPWAYQDAKGNWHTTRGSRAKPFLKPAASEHGAQYRDIIDSEMRGE